MPILAFLIIPFIELYLLIALGSEIGAGWTVAWVIFSALIGLNVARQQGMARLEKLRAMQRGDIPAEDMSDELIGGILLMFAALMLLLPGIMTDTIGILLLIPPLRLMAARALRGVALRRGQRMHGAGGGYGSGGQFYDAQYTNKSGNGVVFIRSYSSQSETSDAGEVHSSAYDINGVHDVNGGRVEELDEYSDKPRQATVIDCTPIEKK